MKPSESQHSLERLAEQRFQGRMTPVPRAGNGGLQHLLDNVRIHERIPAHVDPGLTWLSWLSVLALVAQFLIVGTWGQTHDGLAGWGVTHWAFSGFGHPAIAQWLCGPAIIGALVGSVFTRGFTRATAIGHNGLIALVGAGILAAIPTLWITAVIVAMIVLWVAILIGCIAVLIGILAAALE